MKSTAKVKIWNDIHIQVTAITIQGKTGKQKVQCDMS